MAKDKKIENNEPVETGKPVEKKKTNTVSDIPINLKEYALGKIVNKYALSFITHNHGSKRLPKTIWDKIFNDPYADHNYKDLERSK